MKIAFFEIEELEKKFLKKNLFVYEKKTLLNHPKVVVTPHNAFNTWESLERGNANNFEKY